MPREFFPKVKEAREVLKEKALELVELQMTIIKEAIANGNFEAASKATQWLIEHMPNEDGERLIDSSAAKPKELEGTRSGPAIQIGIALGGIQRKELPETQVYDVTPKAGTKSKNE